MVIAATGHRPDKLYGYDMGDVRYRFLLSAIKNYLKDKGCSEGISGMALGMDIIFALAVLELKSEGFPIKLTCAIPCRNHKAKWIPSAWTEAYDRIQALADAVVIVSDREYDQFVMQTRNVWMVDRTDRVLAAYNGTSGGTKNCVDYARGKGVPVDVLNPYSLILAEV